MENDSDGSSVPLQSPPRGASGTPGGAQEVIVAQLADAAVRVNALTSADAIHVNPKMGISGFVKTTKSDLEGPEAAELLRTFIGSLSPSVVFSEEQVLMMAEVCSVLRIEAGSSVLRKGEAASFFGLLLQGQLHRLGTDGGHVQAVDPGGIIGSVGCFEQGVRTHEMKANSPAVVAVLRYADLKKLRGPALSLQLKLTQVLCSEVLKESQAWGVQSADDAKAATSETIFQGRAEEPVMVPWVTVATDTTTTAESTTNATIDTTSKMTSLEPTTTSATTAPATDAPTTTTNSPTTTTEPTTTTPTDESARASGASEQAYAKLSEQHERLRQELEALKELHGGEPEPDMEPSAENQREELLAQNQRLTRGALQAEELSTLWEADRKRLERRVEQLEHDRAELKKSLFSYTRILKVFTVNSFVKSFLIRKRLRLVHAKAVELTTHSLVEQVSHTPRMDQSVQRENPYDLTVRTNKLKNSWPWNKFARAPIQTMVLSLDAEVSQLAVSISEVRRQKRHWRETADSFFQRNIVLTNQYLSHDQNLQEALAKAVSLKSNAKKMGRDYNQLRLQLSSTVAQSNIHEAEVKALTQRDRKDMREKKAEMEALFERSVELRRRAVQIESMLQAMEARRRLIGADLAGLKTSRDALAQTTPSRLPEPQRPSSTQSSQSARGLWRRHGPGSTSPAHRTSAKSPKSMTSPNSLPPVEPQRQSLIFD